MGRTSSLALAAMMVMAACESADDVDFDELAAAAKDARCTAAVRCGLVPDKATCMVARTSDWFRFDANFQSAVHAGRIRFDRAAAQRCFDVVAAMACDRTDDDSFDYYVACVFTPFAHGTLHDGEACLGRGECISGVCSTYDITSCNVGTCVGDRAPAPKVLPDVGMTCSDYGQCVRDAWCGLPVNGVQTCEPRANEGESCRGRGCVYGLGCAGPPGAETCKQLPLLGEPCPDGVCRDAGQYCSATMGTCVRVGLAGESCTSEEQCSSFYPCQLFTTNPPICAPAASVGDRCMQQGDCFEADTYCDISQGFDIATCAPQKADGEACVGYECRTDSYCKRSVAGDPTGVCTQVEACR